MKTRDATEADRPAVEPADLLARAREAARQELESLRGKPEQPVVRTLLTGFGRRYDG